MNFQLVLLRKSPRNDGSNVYATGPKNKSLQPGQDCWDKAGKKQDMIAL